MANVKLSQITSGGSIVVSTDQLVAVRGGTTDVLVTLGTAASTTALTLTTTGTSGAATLSGSNVLNVPNYAGAVSSVFTRTGAVVAAAGDYNASQISGVAPRVVTAAGAVTITTADLGRVVVINKTTGAATTVNLPTSPTAGDKYTIKDGKGDAAPTNNITVTPATGNIDGLSTFVMNVNYQSATFVYNGTQWNVI